VLKVKCYRPLIQTLLKHELIDEFRLWIFPVLLGTGKRLFENSTVPARLELVETKTSSTEWCSKFTDSQAVPSMVR
jgi:dihydrofolate reductase